VGAFIRKLKRKKVIPYNPLLKELARQLRNNSTPSEILLWRYLKRRQMLSYDFERQKPIDNYIVDFFCNELLLAIEIDGDTHNYKYNYDRERQERLEKLGIEFLRFTDIDVKRNIEGVLSAIEHWINGHKDNEFKNEYPPLHPSQEGNPPLHPSQEGRL